MSGPKPAGILLCGHISAALGKQIAVTQFWPSPTSTWASRRFLGPSLMTSQLPHEAQGVCCWVKTK